MPPQPRTRGPAHDECVADPPDLASGQACQVAVKKGLIGAAQHRRRGRPLTLTVHNVTTARYLVRPRYGREKARRGRERRKNVAQAPRE